jgi:two-component system, sensor histidine kinase LadS
MQLTVKGYAYSNNRPSIFLSGRPFAVVVAVVLLLLAIAWLDYATVAAPVQHLYYLPIILAALELDYAGGIACALIAVGLYHVANEHLRALSYGESDYLQIALFLAVGIVAARLARDRREIKRIAHTDDLTGLHNLRSFEVNLISILGEAQTRRSATSMLVLDLDRLKAINEDYGHLAGAEAVRAVGHLIAHCFDGHAVACRYGGDEFAVALPNCDEQTAFEAAETLRKAVENYAPVLAGRDFPEGALTISIGVAVYLPDEVRNPVLVGEDLFRAADSALYRAKREGRNCVFLNSDRATDQRFVAEAACVA